MFVLPSGHKNRYSIKRAPIILSADFSTETLQARRDWQEIFKVMKSREQPRLFFPPKLSFRIKAHTKKGFPDKEQLKESITTKPVLHEMLKGPLQNIKEKEDEEEGKEKWAGGCWVKR